MGYEIVLVLKFDEYSIVVNDNYGLKGPWEIDIQMDWLENLELPYSGNLPTCGDSFDPDYVDNNYPRVYISRIKRKINFLDYNIEITDLIKTKHRLEIFSQTWLAEPYTTLDIGLCYDVEGSISIPGISRIRYFANIK